VYFGLLLDKSKVGVAESEKWVAAIFLLSVWPLEPPGRSFLPYSGLILCDKAYSSYRTWTARNAFNKKTRCNISKSVARKYCSETESTYTSARNGSKCREIDRNSKNVCKKSSWSNLKWICKTGSSYVLWPTFVEIENRGAESEKRVTAVFLLPVWPLEPPERSFLPYCGLYRRRIAHRRLEMLSIRKLRATNLNLWTRSTIQKPEILSKVPEIVRNVGQ